MLHKSVFAVPQQPGKIIFSKRQDAVYVLLETGRTYYPDRQYCVPKRVLIGKLVDPEDRTKMYPNEKFFELFKQDPPEEHPVPKFMKVLVAMDSFKGSLSAYDAGNCVKVGVEQAGAALLPESTLTCVNLPLADGGEGLIDCLSAKLCAQGFERVTLDVHCANLSAPKVRATMLVRGNECIIESAQALGLPLIPLAERNIMQASSYGLGQMIAKALDLGCTDLKIGLGGSATNDLGLGMVQALGVKFAGASGTGGTPVTSVESWREFTGLYDNALKTRLAGCTVTLLSDVTNPLLGEHGATYVFGGQKGADTEQKARLEAALSAGAALLTEHYGTDLTCAPGAGAAGGLGAALMYFMGAKPESGIDVVLKLLNFDAELKAADLVITGEGNLDTQTLGGKGPMGVARRAQAQGVPTIALCGGRDAHVDPTLLKEQGLCACFSIAPGPIDLKTCMEQGPALLTNAAYNVMATYLLGRRLA